MLVVLALLVAGCSNGDDDAPQAAPSPTASPVAGLVDVGAGVLLDTAVADGASITPAPAVAQPYAEYEQLSDVVQVIVRTQAAGGARIALPVRRSFDPNVDVPLVLVADSPDGPWTPLAGTAVPGRELVSATTPHFSFFTAILVPVRGIISELEKIVEQATSGALAEAEAPTCAKEKQAHTQGWAITSTGKDTVRWCLGVADSPPRRLSVVNNRRYPLSVAHPGAQEIQRTDSAVELANYAKRLSPDRTLLLPRDSVTYTLAGPAKLTTEFDSSAQSLYALQTGGELAFNFLTKFGLVGGLTTSQKVLSTALTSSKCITVLQDPSQAGRILRDCFDPKMLATAFGPGGVFLAALMTAAPVLEYFRSSLNAFGDQLNGRDRYGITVTYSKPKPPAAPPLDPKCREDEVTQALCDFVVAATNKQYGKLTAEERKVAQTATDLPKRPWTVTFCELEGDITVLCEIEYAGAPANSEPTSAGFRLQPSGGEYNPETGGYDVVDEADFFYEVIEYAGLGVGGTFGY